MSEGAAFRRINAARLVRRFPGLLGAIERGETHLSCLVMLRDHLTESNVDDLVAATAGKSKRDIEELLARRAPRPDVPSTLRKLPASKAAPTPEADATTLQTASPTRSPAAAALAARARIEPLAEDRYKLQLTASAGLRDKLERARDLMRHRNPAGDLAVVVERALDALLEQLEKERLGKAARPQKSVRAVSAGRIARSVRRAVFARDGERCTFTSESGERCPSQTLLELDHVHPRALGGADAPANLRVRCRAHNLLHAEEVFGRPRVEARISFCQRKSPSQPPRDIPSIEAPTRADRAP